MSGMSKQQIVDILRNLLESNKPAYHVEKLQGVAEREIMVWNKDSKIFEKRKVARPRGYLVTLVGEDKQGASYHVPTAQGLRDLKIPVPDEDGELEGETDIDALLDNVLAG